MKLLLFSACLLSAVVAAASASAATPPNIVLLISDDQSWTDYSFMGHPDIRTPHLDRLASRSAVFRRGYVPTALCRPSLATIITGLYASQHHIIGNDPVRQPGMTPQDYAARREQLIACIDRVPTLPRLLGQAGYVSHQSGKWWEGSFQRGGFTEGMTRGFPQQGGRHGDDGLKIGRETMTPVLDFIDRSAEQRQPFLLWYAPFLPHTPHTAPERLIAKYQKPGRSLKLAKYYATCEWFDETCGQVLDHLEQRGLAENTLVIYVTDNGWIQRTPRTKVPDGWKTAFAPRSKQSPNEGGVRNPLLFSWPGKIPVGEREELASSLDLFPTILAAAGVEFEEPRPGINLLPYLQQRTPIPRNQLFGESFAHDVVDPEDPEATLLYRWVIRDQWKLILTYDGTVTRYHPVHAHTERRPQLFDLSQDPHEMVNLAALHPQVVQELGGELRKWWPVTQRQVQTAFE